MRGLVKYAKEKGVAPIDLTQEEKEHFMMPMVQKIKWFCSIGLIIEREKTFRKNFDMVLEFFLKGIQNDKDYEKALWWRMLYG